MKKRFSVKVQGDTALISGYSGEQTDIFIPERIGNRPITKIGAYAFSPHKKHGYKPIYEKLEKVELNCVQTLGSGAFCGCSSMKEVVANEVCAIPEHCFSGCSSLEKFDFSKITDIGDHAFENCTSLKSAILPEKLEHLGEWAFYGCSSLEELILSKSIPVLPELCFARCSSLKEASRNRNYHGWQALFLRMYWHHPYRLFLDRQKDRVGSIFRMQWNTVSIYPRHSARNRQPRILLLHRDNRAVACRGNRVPGMGGFF